MEWTLAIVAATLLAVAALSRPLTRSPISTAMVFVGVGLLVGPKVLDSIDVSSSGAGVRTLAEAALALVLFCDASRIDLGSLRHEVGVPARLLGIGLPLTIAVGALAALLVFDQLTLGEALIVGVILAPTDAALGQAVVSEPRVPARIRQGLNVESGLNDGICVPLLFAAIAAADIESDVTGGRGPIALLAEEIGFGLLAGLFAAVAIWAVVRMAGKRNLISPGWQRVIPVAGAGLAYGCAVPLHGSGFIAAFAAGLIFRALLREDPAETNAFAEELGSVLSGVTLLLFGAVLLGPSLAEASWELLLYALLSLTVVRMAPVALAMLGSGARAPTVAFLGWFGPRGLASVVFAVILVEESQLPHEHLMLLAIYLTVGLSVFAHGGTATWLAGRYAGWFERHPRERAPGMEASAVEVTRARDLGLSNCSRNEHGGIEMSSSEPQRSVLPIPDREHVGLTTYDARDPDTSFPPIEPLRPPAGAPNVMIVMLDDIGFGAASAFGGPCNTPTAERLAARGLKYNRFHTTALCSPTRQALLTGRNHHSVGMGGVTEIATSAPGYSSVRPNTAAPLAQTLRLNGYSTAQFGKCHEVPVWETSPMGPFDAWPSRGGGFEHFYGFVGGETNQYAPALYSGTTPVEPDRTPEEGYHLTEDIADRAVSWMRQQKALMPDKPFFLYFAPGATHAPHHVPKEWSDRYRGQFDDGWDALRERSLARQKELGVVPADAELTARPPEIPAWEEMPAELKPVLARQMEVYAGFMEHTDHHVGRLVATLEELEILEETLVYYIIGDNGASAEGTVNGTFNEGFVLNGAAAFETTEFMASQIEKFGTPEANNHYAVGWAHAMDTPYQWTKQVASHWGGTRNGTIVHWPAGIEAKGEVRTQFHHIIDVAQTVLDVAGLPEPTFVNGVQQMPLHGVSMRGSFDDGASPEVRETQYFEMFVNRGIYHKGWTACTRHSTPWVMEPAAAIDEDEWELYAPDDWTQARDVAAEHPEKLAELQRLFLIEAAKYKVLPLDDRRVERFDPEQAGRPQLVRGKRQILFGGMGRLTENTVLPLKNRSHSITAQVDVPEGGASGVVVAQGGQFGGWSLYLLEGRPVYCYNLFGMHRFKVAAEQAVPQGEHQLRVEFAYDGGGLAKGGTATLYLDGTELASGRIEKTVPMIFSADETTDVGADGGTPVSDDYGSGDSAFEGRVHWVQLDIDESAEDADHLISAEERWRIAMARQ